MPTNLNLIGHTLDEKYRIDKQLGQGGMGAVYLATHLGTERPVALKVIMPEFMTHNDFVERFRREAKAAGRLLHPNVVNVTDFGFAPFQGDRVAYLVMEYLNGCTLGDLLKKAGRLPIGLIVDIVEQVCLAVDLAHRQGIIHRDLKPDNIWLQPDGRGGYLAKVLDFGLAKLQNRLPYSVTAAISARGNAVEMVDLDAPTQIENNQNAPTIIHRDADNNQPSSVIDSSSRNGSEIVDLEPLTLIKDDDPQATQAQTRLATANPIDHAVITQEQSDNLTHAGAILGTPVYMSPEQCLGQTLDARSDIYSLGIIVYQMLCGQPPFTGAGGGARKLISQHILEAPPALDLKKHGIARSVAALVMSALAKDPANRPNNAIAFATALRANSEGELPILREAFDIYRRQLPTFFLISFCLYFPFLILNYLLVMATMTRAPGLLALPAQINYLLHKSYWIFSLALILFANSLNCAAFTPIVEQLRLSQARKIKIGEALRTFFSRSGALISATLLANISALLQLFKLIIPGLKAYADYSLVAPVTMMEAARGQQALARSKLLVSRLRSTMFAIQARNFFIASLVLLSSPIVFMLIGLATSLIGEESIEIMVPRQHAAPAFIFVPLAFVTIPWLTLIAFYPLYGLATSIYYFKVRQAGGELLKERADAAADMIDIYRPSRFLANRAAILIVVLALLLFGWLALKDLALTFAAAGNFSGMAEALLTVGANANARIKPEFLSNFETTPLITAVGNDNQEIARLLLEKGADPNISNQYGWTPLMEVAKKGDEDFVKLLVAKGANVNAKNNPGFTALMWAAKNGDANIVNFLLDHGADVNARSSFGDTALILAARGGHAYVIKPLLDRGANVNARDDSGNTPLSLASKGGDSYIIKLLQDKGGEGKGGEISN